MSSCSGPCGTNVSLCLFQEQKLNDSEFAKNVKGLEGMLRVRERLGESSRVCVPAPNSALHSGRRDAGSVAPGSASVGISGGCGPPLRVSFSGGAARVFSELTRVHFADGGVGVLSARAVENSVAFKVTPSAEERAVFPRSGLVSHATAGECERIIGLRESDFSSSESPCTFHNSRIHGVSSRVCVGPFSCSAAGVSAFASVLGSSLRGGGRGKFSAGRRCTGAGCRFTSQEATGHRHEAGQGRCGHTFPPPGGS